MTGPALQSMGKVALMRKIDKVGKSLQTYPGDGLLLLPMAEQSLAILVGCGDVLMAPHAEAHRWNSGCRGLWGVSMAVQTIQSELTGMDFMTEGDGLPVLLGQICAALRIEKTDGNRDDAGQEDDHRAVPPGFVHGVQR
jgi:hypothetical protein